jgi:hypothetical protein
VYSSRTSAVQLEDVRHGERDQQQQLQLADATMQQSLQTETYHITLRQCLDALHERLKRIGCVQCGIALCSGGRSRWPRRVMVHCRRRWGRGRRRRLRHRRWRWWGESQGGAALAEETCTPAGKRRSESKLARAKRSYSRAAGLERLYCTIARASIPAGRVLTYSSWRRVAW